MITASRHAPAKASNAVPPNRKAYYFYLASVLIALTASAVLVAVIAHAQTAEPILAAQPAATTAPAQAAAGPAVSSPAAVAAPRYSAKDIDRAFVFMDANSDGLISRQEAAGFRSVAKYFDAADTNLDNALSLREFSSALNRP